MRFCHVVKIKKLDCSVEICSINDSCIKSDHDSLLCE